MSQTSTNIACSEENGQRACAKKNWGLSQDQLTILENYYNKNNKLPRRKEKTEISKQYNIDPFALNKWFQLRRNKDYIAQRKKSTEKEKPTLKQTENTTSHVSVKLET